MGLPRILSICLAIALLFAGKSALAATTIDVYTVGPGNYIFSKFGHSAVCVTDAELPQGRCYDFGVTSAPDPATMVWGTLRGEKEFIAVGVDVDVLVKTFSEQDREIFKQTLPLDDAHATALAKALSDAVENHESYAYAFRARARDVVDEEIVPRPRRGAVLGTNPRRDPHHPPRWSPRRPPPDGVGGDVSPVRPTRRDRSACRREA